MKDKIIELGNNCQTTGRFVREKNGIEIRVQMLNTIDRYSLSFENIPDNIYLFIL